MFPTLSTWLNCLVKKKRFPLFAKNIFHSFFLHFFFEKEVFVASFLKLFLLSHFDFSFFLLLLFIEGKIFLLVSSGFLSSSLHFSFVRLFFSFFTLFSLCFSLFLLFFFFEHMSFLFHFSTWFKLFCVFSFFPFFLSPFSSPISCFFNIFERKTLRIVMSTWFFSIPFVDFLFLQQIKVNVRKCIVLNCVSHLFCIQVLYLLFFLTPFDSLKIYHC